MIKFTYNYVYDFFKENGCQLLETKYVDCKTKMKYICKCGNESYTTFDSFKHGKRCRKCQGLINNEKQKLDYDYVYNYFLMFNCELLEDNYINNRTTMKYKCSCGNISHIKFYNFQQGKRCKKCAGCEKPSDETINKCFKQRNFILLENSYINCQLKTLKYQCPQGHVGYISWNNFSRGNGCGQCAKENKCGKNNYNWNFNKTMEDRILDRSFLEYKIWRKQVFERDHYICQICNKTFTILNAHHLDGYHWCVEKRLDLDNGITLCNTCHGLFHKIYGRTNNTKDQFLIFKNNQINIKQEIG